MKNISPRLKFAYETISKMESVIQTQKTRIEQLETELTDIKMQKMWDKLPENLKYPLKHL